MHQAYFQNGHGHPLDSKTSSDSFGSGQQSFTSRLKPPFQEPDRASSGNESLLELYRSSQGSPEPKTRSGQALQHGQTNGRKRVASQESSKVRRKGSKGPVSTTQSFPVDEMDENSKWIHRDKLAQIESREMIAMGMSAPAPSRTSSRAKSTKTTKSAVDAQEPTPELEEDENLFMPGATEGHDLEKDVSRQESMPKESTQEDIDSFARHVTQRVEDARPPSRPGTSRIPVPVGSHEDDAPLEMKRKRGESFGVNSRRTRSKGGENQAPWENTENTSAPSSPPSGSPPKQRNVSKGTYSSNRKASAPRKSSGPGPRSRANSTTDSQRRPTTSGGSRPPTARPEGEAPWIATMYKPDPLLPPDQQMLPTHAKRLAEKRAEAEGKAGKANEDAEFTLLESNDDKENEATKDDSREPPAHLANANSGKQLSPQQARSSMQEMRESGQWPLRTASQQQQWNERRLSPRLSPRPDVSERRSYNLMPYVPVNEQERRTSAQLRPSPHGFDPSFGIAQEEQKVSNQIQAPSNPPAQPQPEEKKSSPKKEKTCLGCCVVM
ncbi:MAG: hypothetical protein Q9162_006142 [Coniocarpon cinnabarinum]